MFVDCETWRKTIKLDDVVPTWDYPEKEKVSKYYPQFYHKTDKDGRPMYIEQLGAIDLTAMRKITSDERMLTNLAVEYERVADPRLPACSRKAGVLLETCCTVMDMKSVGLGRAPQVFSYVKQASNLSQNYYPERLGKLYIINAPWGFSTVWNVIKAWLDPVTVEKIHVLGSNYKTQLLAQIPAENLPKEFGGSCACPGGCQFSDMGPWREQEWARPAWWEKVASAPAPSAPAPSAPAETDAFKESDKETGTPAVAQNDDAAAASLAPAPAPTAAPAPAAAAPAAPASAAA